MFALVSHRYALATATAAALLALAACSDKGSSGTDRSPEPSGETLSEAIAGTGDLSTVFGALRDAGLSRVFDNAGSYTLLAPTDAAFASLGESGKALTQPGERAEMAAVLRDHIVPGYLTPSDIRTALDAQGGRVNVKTMGDHQLRFTRDGEGLRVTNEDGSTAMITGDALKASNGVAIPIDGVLKNLSPTD